jgi:RNA polymerase sigma-70 factor (ECF subfamily)
VGPHGNQPITLSSPHLRRDAIEADAQAAALEELFLRCEHRLGKYLVQMVRDRALAEDLLQDTFQDAFRARRQFPNLRNAEAWLFAIANRRALRALRRQRRFESAFRRLTKQYQAPIAPPGGDDQSEVRELLERHLTPEDRALVLLHYLHGFSAVELAEMTDRTPAAVRQRLARARARLLDAATGSTAAEEAV